MNHPHSNAQPTLSTTSSPFATARHVRATRKPWKARAVLAALARVPLGQLRLTLPGGEVQMVGPGGNPSLSADLRLDDWSVIDAVVAEGDIGFGEAYMAGLWHTHDLAGLLRFFLANREHLEQLIYGTWWGRAINRVRHALRRNSRAGSARNIQAHYDLGNDFYRLWLDPSMAYSSAYWEPTKPAQSGGSNTSAQRLSMAEAQAAKFRRALRMAGVREHSRVLEIGCGWGSLADLAVNEFNAHVTGVTLSHEQLAWAHHRLGAAQAVGQVDLRLQDYRDITTTPETRFDAIVSIEMFEAVGEAYWDGYWRSVAQHLKPGGRACIQTITIRNDLFARYRMGSDFIQRHIFPGGMLPSPEQVRLHAEQAGLRVIDQLDFGPDYAETLRQWRQAFESQLDAVRALGYDERFIRMWRFYLCYCEAGFDDGALGVSQFTLTHA